MVIIDENGANEFELLRSLRSTGIDYKYISKLGCDRFDVFVRFPEAYITTPFEENRLSIRHIQIPQKESFLLAIVHLPSKLNSSSDSQAMACQNYVESIAAMERTVRHQRTVLIGDFNMNPFESGIISASAFNATMSRQIAKQGRRIVSARQYPYFYNPMWNLMGDFANGPPGTHYNRRGELVELQWNMYDQVMLRPELLPYLDSSSVQILTTDGIVSFLSKNGTPDAKNLSDHLPLLFSLSI